MVAPRDREGRAGGTRWRENHNILIHAGMILMMKRMARKKRRRGMRRKKRLNRKKALRERRDV